MGGYLDYLVCGRNPWFGARFTLCSDTRIIIIIIIIIITIIIIIIITWSADSDGGYLDLVCGENPWFGARLETLTR